MNFTIRVYGILKNEAGDILVSDEFIQGNLYTKFCGGGLEFGEGTRECLQREFKEELGIHITVGDHFYTTDFFVESKFAKEQQVISIYYEVTAKDELLLPTENEAVTAEEFFKENMSGAEIFRFIKAETFSEKSVSLPIDKVVAKMLSAKN